MPKLFISDERMLQLMEWAIADGIAVNQADYLEKIGFTRTNISNTRKGQQGFTKEHIWNACQLTGASADYIFGFANTRLRKPERKPMEQLREAVRAVDLELKSRR